WGSPRRTRRSPGSQTCSPRSPSGRPSAPSRLFRDKIGGSVTLPVSVRLADRRCVTCERGAAATQALPKPSQPRPPPQRLPIGALIGADGTYLYFFQWHSRYFLPGYSATEEPLPHAG